MMQIEDKIKQRLEGYESNLPEGDLAEFKALLDKTSAQKGRKAIALKWLAPVAAVAGLALFITFGYSPEHEASVGKDERPIEARVSESAVEDTTKSDIATDVKADTSIKPQYTRVQASVVKVEMCDSVTSKVNTEEMQEVAVNSDSNIIDELTDSVAYLYNNVKGMLASTKVLDTRKPANTHFKKVVGGGLLAGIGAALAYTLPSSSDNHIKLDDNLLSSPGGYSPPKDEKTGRGTHYFPLRTGISLRIPLNKKWSLTTGVDYSWYYTQIDYSLSGIKHQHVHYVGLPIRADYSFVRKKRMNIYLGAGVTTDFCVAAFENGKAIEKDGVGFSLAGAGGIQFNFSKHVGLYLEPELSWNVPSDNQTLRTYKSEDPFMFSVSSGLRITLKDKR